MQFLRTVTAADDELISLANGTQVTHHLIEAGLAAKLLAILAALGPLKSSRWVKNFCANLQTAQAALHFGAGQFHQAWLLNAVTIGSQMHPPWIRLPQLQCSQARANLALQCIKPSYVQLSNSKAAYWSNFHKERRAKNFASKIGE